MRRIFISYRHSSARDLAQDVSDMLENRRPDVKVERDAHALGSDPWDQYVVQRLRECSGVVVLVDKDFEPALNEENYVTLEVMWARLLGKKVFIARIDADDDARALEWPMVMRDMLNIVGKPLRRGHLRADLEEIAKWIDDLPLWGFEDRVAPGDVVREVLRNMHDTLQFLWRTLAVSGVLLATGIVAWKLRDEVAPIVSVSGVPPVSGWGGLIGNHGLLMVTYAAYLLIFLRLYFGDSRYVSISYIQSTHLFGLASELRKYVRLKHFLDVSLLIATGVLLCFVALFVDKPKGFVYAVCVFFAFNVMFLSIQLGHRAWARWSGGDPRGGAIDPKIPIGVASVIYHRIGKATRNGEERFLPNRYWPIATWWVNNLAFLVLVAATALAAEHGVIPDEAFVELSIALIFVNSVADLILTSHFYFPSLGQAFPDENRV